MSRGVLVFRAAGLVAVLGLSLSCRKEHAAPQEAEQAALGGEVAARVGAEVIPLSLVRNVAVAQRITSQEALHRLVDDAIAASAARARGLDRDGRTSWLVTAARGRAAAEHLRAEARRGGPPTDAEIAELTAQYWREVDRPVTVRTVHALAQRPKKPDAEAEARAKAVAEELRRAVAGAKNADEFTEKAKAVPHPGVEVVVQPLPAFADDGAVSEGPGNMDEVFAKAAHALVAAGDTSPVVETTFGWHVIRLVERIPEQRMSLAARRLAFTEEAYTRRARALTTARLLEQKALSPVEIAAPAENLMRSITGSATGSTHGPTP